MATLRVRHVFEGREEPPWEDDGCEELRRAAVASVPGLHPRVRRAYELWLRHLGPLYWLAGAGAGYPYDVVGAAAEQVREINERMLERLRAERLEAEAKAAERAARERILSRPLRRPT